MAIKAYLSFDELVTDHQILIGDDFVIFDGDQTGIEWMDGVIRLVNGETTEEVNIIDAVYDDVEDETEFTFAAGSTATYPIGSKIYKLQSPVRYICGRLVGDADQTSFVCTLTQLEVSGGPSEVRKFLDGSEFGSLLTRADDGTADWRWNSSLTQVELGYTPGIGETVVAFSQGVPLFNDKYLAENVAEVNTIDVYLYLTTHYDCVFAGFDEIMSTDVGAEWYKVLKEVSPDTWEEYSNQTFCGHEINDVVHIKVKNYLIDAEAAVRNYYNISLYLGHLEMPTN